MANPDDMEKNATSVFSSCIVATPIIQALCNAHPLPEPTESSARHWFSVYRRLFAMAVLANVAVICAMIGKAATAPNSFSYADATTAVAANLFAATVMRHEHAVNLFFRLAIALSRHLPLYTRRYAAKVYSYGGIHSGCGLSAALWYIFFTVLAVKQFQFANKGEYYTLVATMAFLLGLFVVQISISILPTFRSRHHDLWELSHRFVGWAMVAVVWAQTILITVATARSRQLNTGIVLVRTPAFWFLSIITLFIVHPWLYLRRVEVNAERLSSHATRLWFHHRSVQTCAAIRLSRHPLLDNHGFATIPNEDGEKGFSVLVSKAGDFTADLIVNPPTHLWKRGAYTIGVARVALLFRPLVLVATGSGIGPCLSFLQSYPDWPVRVIWSTRDPQSTYGEQVINSVLRADPEAVIISTSATGRPPLLALTYALFQATQAEAVVLISNPTVTKEVVDGLERRKVPAFGAIFDS